MAGGHANMSHIKEHAIPDDNYNCNYNQVSNLPLSLT